MTVMYKRVLMLCAPRWSDAAHYCSNAVKVGFVERTDTVAMERLCALSQGNFLYLNITLDDLHHQRLSWVCAARLQNTIHCGARIALHLPSMMCGRALCHDRPTC
jgi:hypothetical protein